MATVALLADRVRGVLAERGLDPMAEAGQVAAIVGAEVADYLCSAPGHRVADLPAEDLAADVYDLVAGFGPLQRLMDDPDIEELWWNRPDRIFVARGGRAELTSVVLRDDEVAVLVERMLALIESILSPSLSSISIR